MYQGIEDDVIETARRQAARIIREENAGTAAECLDDLIDYLHQAEDTVRETAGRAGVEITPWPMVGFPDRRTVMELAIKEISEETKSCLKLWQVREIAPDLWDLVSMNINFGYEALEDDDENHAVQLAMMVLMERSLAMARQSLRGLQPKQKEALRQAAIREAQGKEPAAGAD